MTLWRMCIAYWIPKATYTHVEYVIFIVSHCNNGCRNALQCYVIRLLPSCWAWVWLWFLIWFTCFFYIGFGFELVFSKWTNNDVFLAKQNCTTTYREYGNKTPRNLKLVSSWRWCIGFKFCPPQPFGMAGAPATALIIETYLMAMRRISFFESFLSGGCVGTSFRSSANAPLTFCCRQRSRLLVNILRTMMRGEGCGCVDKSPGWWPGTSPLLAALPPMGDNDENTPLSQNLRY